MPTLRLWISVAWSWAIVEHRSTRLDSSMNRLSLTHSIRGLHLASCIFISPLSLSLLVGGFNPSAKYERQNGFIFPQFSGWKLKKHLKTTNLRINNYTFKKKYVWGWWEWVFSTDRLIMSIIGAWYQATQGAWLDRDAWGVFLSRVFQCRCWGVLLLPYDGQNMTNLEEKIGEKHTPETPNVKVKL